MDATIFTDMGLKRVKELSRTHRFTTVLVEDEEGSRVVGKVAASKKFNREVENEIWWNLTLRRLREAEPSVGVQAPEVFEFGPGWYIADYFDKPKLLEKEAMGKDLYKHIERISTVLVHLDQQLRIKPLQPARHDSAMNDYLLEKAESWTKKPLSEGLLTTERVNQGKALIEKYRKHVAPSFQHGDFVPWHMFDLGSEIGLIDGEHSSLVKPRYYDLAYIYTRVSMRLHAHQEAAQILEGFLAKSGTDRDDFAQAFLPIITLRAFGMHTDALDDLGDGTKGSDYREEAVRLLDLCLSEDLGRFLN